MVTKLYTLSVDCALPSELEPREERAGYFGMGKENICEIVKMGYPGCSACH